MAETVALSDETGSPSGSAVRSIVRRDNLRHGATAVIARNSLGEVYLHRQTDKKDVYPGLHDRCAGGVLRAGEDSLDGARREVVEEVAWGRWMSLEELGRRLADRRTAGEDAGCRTTEVEGRWIDREPLRPDATGRLLAETTVLPWLAPLLPLPVPQPRVVEEDPRRVRHIALPGSPVGEGMASAHAAALAELLRTLHAIPTAAAAAESLLGRAGEMPFDTVVHGGLGPAYVLADGDQIEGVIGWDDVHVGDRARDLPWLLHGTPPAFADAFARSYGVTDALAARALDWHRLSALMRAQPPRFGRRSPCGGDS